MNQRQTHLPDYSPKLPWKLYRFLPIDFQKKRLFKHFRALETPFLNFPLEVKSQPGILLIITKLTSQDTIFSTFFEKLTQQYSHIRILCPADIASQISNVPPTWLLRYSSDQIKIGSDGFDELLNSLIHSQYQQAIFLDSEVPFNLGYLIQRSQIPLRIGHQGAFEDDFLNIQLQSGSLNTYFNLFQARS